MYIKLFEEYNEQELYKRIPEHQYLDKNQTMKKQKFSRKQISKIKLFANSVAKSYNADVEIELDLDTIHRKRDVNKITEVSITFERYSKNNESRTHIYNFAITKDEDDYYYVDFKSFGMGEKQGQIIRYETYQCDAFYGVEELVKDIFKNEN